MAHCRECKMDFSKPSNLRAHVKRKHPDKLDKLAPITRNPSGSGQYACSECEKCFATIGTLRFHVKQKHPDKLEEIAPVEKQIYKCNQCNCQFGVLKQLIKHRRCHNIIKPRKCSLCQYTSSSTDMLVQHYKHDHSLEIINETLEFDSVEAFQVWKSRTEADTFASFVQTSGAKKTTKHIKTMYFCHRSGNIRPKGNNLRKTKMCGSNKIGGYCPAKMTVYTKNDKCTVQFCKSHVGHEQEKDMGHLFLTKSQRENIAAKIGAKIPLQVILDEVRNSTKNNCRLERIHLLTKKDLHNIKKVVKLKGTSVCHANEAVSVEAWVNDLKMGDSVPYKSQESLCQEFIQLLPSSDNEIQNVSSENNFVININQKCEDISGLVKNESVTDEQQQVDTRRKKLLQHVQEELLHVTSLEELEAAERLFASLKTTLAAMRSQHQSSENLTITSLSNTAHNQNIQPLKVEIQLNYS